VKLIKFVLYKTKLKMRRRYSVLEGLLLQFRLGKILFREIHFVFLIVSLLFGSIFVAIGISQLLQQIDFTAKVSKISWILLYFALLSYSCLSGSMLTGRVLFPEDAQIMARLPLSQRRLSLFIFAEHISSVLFNILFYFIIPLCVPLALATQAHVATGMVFLVTALLLFWGLSTGFLLALLIRLLKFFMLKHGAFWKVLLLQGIFAALGTIGSYFASIYFLGFSTDRLRQIPMPAFEVNDFGYVNILQWLEMGGAVMAGLGQAMMSVLQHPYGPHVLAADLVHKSDLSDLGFIVAGMLVTLSAVYLLTSRFNVHDSFTKITKMSVPDQRDNFVCQVLNRLQTSHTHSIINVLFKKNLCLFSRNLEIILAGIGLFGGAWPWIGLGIAGGIGSSFSGTEFGDIWNTINVSMLIPIIYSVLLFSLFYDLRFLLGVDGEQRNVSLLRLAGFSLADLYRCQIRLLGIALLPPLLLLVILFAVLGVFSQYGFAQWSFTYWSVMILNIVFISFNVVRITGVSFVVLPRFDVAHFEESGKFLEQGISEKVAILFIGFLPLFVLPSLAFADGRGAAWFLVTILWYTLITFVINVVSDIVVRKMKWLLAIK